MALKLFLTWSILRILLIQGIRCNDAGSVAPPTTPTSAPSPTPPASPTPCTPSTAAYIPSSSYPNPRRDDSVQDTYPGGVIVKDPYRWMENADSPETKKFVDDEMAITRPYLDKSPFRAELQARYKELYNNPTFAGPFQIGKYFFSFQNTGFQNQDVLCKSDTMKDDGKPFIDPNTLNKDGNIGLDSGVYAFSDDGLILAYELIENGSDWRTVHFKHVEKGDIYKDKLEKVKFTHLSWTKDNKGIFYAGFRDKKGKADGSENDANKNKKLYYHVLGTDQSEDIVVAEFPDNPDYVVDGTVSNCGKYLIVNPAEGTDNNLILIADISNGVKAKPELKPIISKMEANYYFIGNNENKFIFQTNKDADNYKLISVDVTNPNPDPKSWKEIVREDQNNKLEFAKAVHDKYVILCYTENVTSVLQLHDITSGKIIKKFQLDIGTVNFGSLFGDRKTPHVFFNFESFLTPGITYHCDLSKEPFDLEVIREIKLKNFDREQFSVDQVFYESTDKTKVPMHIVYKKGLKKDGTSFAFLTGYGGFGDSILPYFVVNRLVVISNFDGFHCVANIRGGGEYGEKWHRDGSREKKQNSFNDFQAAADFLIKEKYTNNKLLSVSGGSNGGLLMGACLNQRPDLFGVVFAEVGVMDMLRYDKFTDGHEWVTEYGSASDPKIFPILYKYSPLHNVRIPDQADKQYPAVMLATADHDDRVSPLHSLKFAATLQYEATKHTNQKNPFIIRIEKNAGHNDGNSLDEEVADFVDMMSFTVINTGIQFHPYVTNSQ